MKYRVERTDTADSLIRKIVLFRRELRKQCSTYLPEISRIAEYDGKIAGAVYYTKAWVVNDYCRHKVVVLGPLAVEPDYYPKFGFERAEKFGITDADGNTVEKRMRRNLLILQCFSHFA